MRVQEFNKIKSWVQYSSALISIFFNTMLISLILTKYNKKMKSYNNLMIYFAISSIIYSILDISVAPNIQSCPTCFFIFSKYYDYYLNRQFLISLIVTLCSYYLFTVTLITIHFLFRFYTVKYGAEWKYFDGQFLLLWFSVPFLVSSPFFIFTVFGFNESLEKSNIIKNTLLLNYDLKIDEIVYIFISYTPINDSPNFFVVWLNVGYLSVTISTEIFLIITFAIKTYQRLNNLEFVLSRRTRKFQRQLLKALIYQTSFPITLLHIPVVFLVFLPLVGIEIGCFSNFVCFTVAIYPAIDPLPTMFFVSYYRKSMIGFFKICWMKWISLNKHAIF